MTSYAIIYNAVGQLPVQIHETMRAGQQRA